MIKTGELRKYLLYLGRQLKCCHARELPDKFKVYYRTKKQYKSLLRKKHRIFRATLVNKLYDTEKDSPKAFWDTLREIETAEKVDSDCGTVISPMDWLSHSKSLMVKNIRSSVPSDTYNDCSFVSNNLLDYVKSENSAVCSL